MACMKKKRKFSGQFSKQPKNIKNTSNSIIYLFEWEKKMINGLILFIFNFYV